MAKKRVCLIRCVFNHSMKVAFHTPAWGADIDALGCGLGWCWDFAAKGDESFFLGKGYQWFNDRMDVLATYATKPELIWDGKYDDAEFDMDEP
jgi:hypothetical protein